MNIGMRVPLKIDVETLLSMCDSVRVDSVGIAAYKVRYARRLEVLRRYRLLQMRVSGCIVKRIMPK